MKGLKGDEEAFGVVVTEPMSTVALILEVDNLSSSVFEPPVMALPPEKERELRTLAAAYANDGSPDAQELKRRIGVVLQNHAFVTKAEALLRPLLVAYEEANRLGCTFRPPFIAERDGVS